jgi:hypothetical protein
MPDNDSSWPIEDGQESWYESFGPVEGTIEVFEEASQEILAYAQDNAPWADRTGDARAGLDVEVYEEAGEVYLDLFHTVEYGQWLETIQDGAFATIMPTLET